MKSKQDPGGGLPSRLVAETHSLSTVKTVAQSETAYHHALVVPTLRQAFGALGCTPVSQGPNSSYCCSGDFINILMLLMLMLLWPCTIIQIVQQIGSDVDGSIVITIPVTQTSTSNAVAAADAP